MSHVLTLVASKGNPDISSRHIEEVGKILSVYGPDLEDRQEWLAKGRALDLGPVPELSGGAMTHLRDFASKDKFDVFVMPVEGRRKKLLLADMDSTIVTTETLDELADYAGIKDQIAAITARAMEGEIDFHEALRERVALLEGLSATALDSELCKIQLSKGADFLVKTMRENGAHCVLVSGGFTVFTAHVAARAGFHAHHGNVLGIAGEALSGTVEEPILDKTAKVCFLEQYLAERSLEPVQALTIGDGANDIPMLKAAGLGIGYRPKQAVAAEIPNLIIHGDLTAALYAQGYRDSDIVK